jgi:alpha-L-fucosidase
MLVDIVSKNGNLLLSIPVRGEGTIDADEVKFLEDMAAWMAVNGEAIYATRPWKVYGEGPAAEEKTEAGRHGGMSDTRKAPYTAADIRFTTKGEILYAIVLAWPESGKVTVKSLPSPAERVTQVRLLGHRGELTWRQTDAGLEVQLPAEKPCDHAFALRITR